MAARGGANAGMLLRKADHLTAYAEQATSTLDHAAHRTAQRSAEDTPRRALTPIVFAASPWTDARASGWTHGQVNYENNCGGPVEEEPRAKYTPVEIIFSLDTDLFITAAIMEQLRALEPAALELRQLVRLDLRNAGLSQLPAALPLCGQLVHLDVGGNPLASLEGIDALPRLRILFATGCGLGPVLPPGGPLARAASIFMLSLKENGLTLLDGDALPPHLGWLIATSNEIAEIRAPLRLRAVRKCMLSHNRLTGEALVPLLEAAPELPMLRVACNAIEQLPSALLEHPSLAWLAIGGNPYARRQLELMAAEPADGRELAPMLDAGAASELSVSEHELGRGSGAVVYRAELRGAPVAVKEWASAHFSDGDARGEWAVARMTSACAHVVRTLAVFEAPRLGMCLELLEGAVAAGSPPSFATVERDVIDPAKHAMGAHAAARVALVIARACAWMHARGLTHGDVYLHNTLLVRGPALDARLSDFGAASAYDRLAHGAALQHFEARAFGFLLEDLLACVDGVEDRAARDDGLERALRAIATECTAQGSVRAATRPDFATLSQRLAVLVGEDDSSETNALSESLTGPR